MKKTYIICLILFVGISVYTGAYFFAKFKFKDDSFNNNVFIINEESSESEDEIVYEAAANDQVICNLTKFVLETYDVNMGVLNEEKINTPVDLLGMSRDRLIIYMKQYMQNPSDEDVDKGLIAFELISFSRDKVVWRKTYSLNDPDVEFYGHSENGYVTIYLNDGITLYDYTNIRTNNLPRDVQESLDKGIHFRNIDELYDFLETYTS